MYLSEIYKIYDLIEKLTERVDKLEQDTKNTDQIIEIEEGLKPLINLTEHDQKISKCPSCGLSVCSTTWYICNKDYCPLGFGPNTTFSA